LCMVSFLRDDDDGAAEGVVATAVHLLAAGARDDFLVGPQLEP